MGNIKIRIYNQKHSKEVQEALFGLGYSWSISGKKVQFQEQDYLYAYSDGGIYFGGDEGYFKQHGHQEVLLQYIPVFTPINTPKEIVELNGKKYYKEDLEKALENIKEIE